MPKPSKVGAYILKVDGTKVPFSRRPTLKEAQEAVGGYVERLLPYHNRGFITAFGDEEGRIKQYLFNKPASELLGYQVVGDIVVLIGWRELRC